MKLPHFVHEEVVALGSLAEAEVIEALDALSESDSLGEALEHEIYATVHFGSSQTHTPPAPVRAGAREPQRYFKEKTVCYRCKREGHISHECREAEKKACTLCGKDTHPHAQCPQMVCIKCGRMGHSAHTCTAAPRRREGCAVCGSAEHGATDCTRYRRNVRVRTAEKPLQKSCSRCGTEGHFAGECPTAPSRGDTSFFISPEQYRSYMNPDATHKEQPGGQLPNPEEAKKGKPKRR